MTNSVKMASIAALVAFGLTNPALASPSYHNHARTVSEGQGPLMARSLYDSVRDDMSNGWSSYRSGPRQDPNDAWGGYFASPIDNPNYHGSNGG